MVDRCEGLSRLLVYVYLGRKRGKDTSGCELQLSHHVLRLPFRLMLRFQLDISTNLKRITKFVES